MTIGFQDKVDISVDAIKQFSEELYAASWLNNVEHIVYCAIMTNDRNVLNFFRPYQVSAMKDLIAQKYWIMYDADIELPVVRMLDQVIADKIPIKNGAD
jgi:hypothetical protein